MVNYIEREAKPNENAQTCGHGGNRETKIQDIVFIFTFQFLFPYPKLLHLHTTIFHNGVQVTAQTNNESLRQLCFKVSWET